MPIIHKSEQSTLGSPVNLRDITTKIYDLDEIKNYQLDEAINNHPLVKRPTAIRSKLAYKEIIHNTKPTKNGYKAVSGLQCKLVKYLFTLFYNNAVCQLGLCNSCINICYLFVINAYAALLD